MPLTTEQLRALPERQEYDDRIMEWDDPKQGLRKGDTVRERIPPKFSYDAAGSGTNGDDIVLFTDERGERWMVDYHLEGGPYKRRFP